MNDEQLIIFEEVKKGSSILISGAAGCGKSYTLKEIIKWATPIKNIGITASTGSAAVLIGGKTLHSFLGIQLATQSAYQLVKMNEKNIALIKKLQELEILVIDEISLINCELFDKISKYLSLIRKINEPFGNVQLILCGDFCQLEPIKSTEYCFQSENFKHIKKMILTKPMRYDDLEFQELLSKLRLGKCDKNMLEQLEKLKHTELEKSDVLPVVMYGKNVDVDKINEEQFKKLKTEKHTYYNTFGKNHKSLNWQKSARLPNSIELAIDAQVVCIWNISDTIVNGSRGIITSLNPLKIKLLNGLEVIINYQIVSDQNEGIYANFIPLKLAWAITHHRSAGMTLDNVIVDLSSWANGQSYTALSRVRNMKSIKIIGDIKEEYFKINDVVYDFYNSCNSSSN
jgi:ATP-dependent DNA helicase PIF1